MIPVKHLVLQCVRAVGWLVGCAAGLAGGRRAWPAVFPLPCRFPGQDTRPGGPPKAGGNEGRSISLEQDSVHVPRARASPISGTPGGRVCGSLPGKEAEPRRRWLLGCVGARLVPGPFRLSWSVHQQRELSSACPAARGQSSLRLFTSRGHRGSSAGKGAPLSNATSGLVPQVPRVPGKGSSWESGRAAQARGGGKPRPGPGLVTVTPPRPSGPGPAWPGVRPLLGLC